MTKPRQAPEIAFENKDWQVLARVVKHQTKPGYEVVIESLGPRCAANAHHCKTLREAVIKAMDIAGVQ
jgi:hypothetical protein